MNVSLILEVGWIVFSDGFDSQEVVACRRQKWGQGSIPNSAKR